MYNTPVVIIMDHKPSSGIEFCFSAEARKLLDADEVIIEETKIGFRIRPATIDDLKTRKISPAGHLTYTSPRAKEFIAKCLLEELPNGDFFISPISATEN